MSKQNEESDNPVFETFMARRTVILSGEINYQSIGEVGRRLITLQSRSPDRINLIIDSDGGSMDAALRLCDLMSTVMTAPVRGIALGSCGSAATFVMLYCNERISTPYSRFLIHSGTRSKISIPIGQTTSENLEQLLKDVKATEEMVVGLYMSRLTPKAWSNKEPLEKERREYVQRLIDRGDQSFDEWMTAEGAIEVGLVTDIVRGKLDIFRD
jgi:ATP-dependent protease ClpP protease subunit